MDFINKLAKDIAFKIGHRLIEMADSITVQPDQIRRMPVTSDVAKSIGYRVSDGTLEIEYQNGRVYQYANVSFGDYMDLMDGRSIGRFINRNIKPFYTCTEVKE
jgi:hypothetical protein